MTTATAEYAKSETATEDYEPFIVGGEDRRGALDPDRRSRGRDAGRRAVTLGAAEFPYSFNADETIHALKGELVVDIESGEKVTLRPGDVASFTKGTKSTWTVTQPFAKLFVISG